MKSDLKIFLRYVCPSMVAMAVAGSYSIVDTVFIGLGCGKVGLAAIALTWPLILLFCAFGDCIGAGASVIIAQSRGAKNENTAQKAFGNMLLLLAFSSIVFGALFLAILRPVLAISGADSEMMPYAIPYATILIVGGFPCMFTMAAISAIRSDGSPIIAMWIVIIELLGNIILDWLFILYFGWGAEGAAYATIASQASGGIFAAAYFISPFSKLRFALANLIPNFRLMREINLTGIPIFGNTIAIIVMLVLHNTQSLRYGGTDGLAAYTLVAALESLGSLLMTGLASGLQPLVAHLYGEGDNRRQNRMGNLGYAAAFAAGIILMLFSFAMRDEMPTYAGLSGAVATLASHGVLISSTAFVFLGIIRVAAYYYQSTGKILHSSIIIYGDAFIVLPLCLFILPPFFGMDGVWLAMPISKLFVFAYICKLWAQKKRRRMQ